MEIGGAIRDLRKARHMTIRDVARATGLSVSLISQVERDLASPSVVSLWKMAKALGVNIGYFFETPKVSGSVVKRHQRKKVMLPASNVVYEVLSPVGKGDMELLMVEIEPGDVTTPDGRVSHSGEECGVVIQGQMQVEVGDQVYALEEGDSIYFESSLPHRLRNVSDRKVVAIWVDKPPFL